MSGFVHVDITADDPERAVSFYNRVFGWSVKKLDGHTPYWLVGPPDGNGTGAGISERERPWQSVTPTIDVPSADAAAAAIVREGGAIVIPKT